MTLAWDVKTIRGTGHGQFVMEDPSTNHHGQYCFVIWFDILPGTNIASKARLEPRSLFRQSPVIRVCFTNICHGPSTDLSKVTYHKSPVTVASSNMLQSAACYLSTAGRLRQESQPPVDEWRNEAQAQCPPRWVHSLKS